MEEAISIVENHYQSQGPKDGRAEYIHFRLKHLRDGVTLFRASSGKERSVCSSLSNLFSSLCDTLSEKKDIDWVIWTDIRDELMRMTIDDWGRQGYQLPPLYDLAQWRDDERHQTHSRGWWRERCDDCEAVDCGLRADPDEGLHVVWRPHSAFFSKRNMRGRRR